MRSILNMAVFCCVVFAPLAFGQTAPSRARPAAPAAPAVPAAQTAPAPAVPAVPAAQTAPAPAAQTTPAAVPAAPADVPAEPQAPVGRIAPAEPVVSADQAKREGSAEAAEQADAAAQDGQAEAAPAERRAALEASPADTAVRNAEAAAAAPAEQPGSAEPAEAAVRDAPEKAALPAGPKRIKLGVMPLESLTGHGKLAEEMTGAVAERLEELGLYDVYLPDDIDRTLAEAGVGKPKNCRDPKCVQDMAKALGLERMIYGTVDMNGAKCGVRLTLIDVSYDRPVESVSIEGNAGVPAKAVVICAVNRAHGHKSDSDVARYHGPEVNNARELLWSTVAVQGTGIFYSVINYGLGGTSGSDGIDYAGHSGQELSGIPALSNQIPMFGRPAALASAYTAVSDDAYGPLYNPAGMPWVTHREGALGYQYRFGLDLLALSYVNKAARDVGFGQALLLATDRDNAMTELFFVSAAGYKYNDMPLFGPVSAGASFKIMGNTVRALSPDSPEGQSFGVGLDIGLMWELSSRIRYGLHVRDIMSFNRWNNATTADKYSEWMPPTMHMGGSYRAGYSAFLVADGQIPLYEDQPWVMAGGMEYEFFRILSLRIGLQKEILNEEADWWKITAGCGFKFDIEPLWGKYLNLDIAYEYNTLELFQVINVSVRVGF